MPLTHLVVQPAQNSPSRRYREALRPESYGLTSGAKAIWWLLRCAVSRRSRAIYVLEPGMMVGYTRLREGRVAAFRAVHMPWKGAPRVGERPVGCGRHKG